MSTNMDLKEIERRANYAVFQDGLTEIILGLFLVLYGGALTVENISLVPDRTACSISGQTGHRTHQDQTHLSPHRLCQTALRTKIDRQWHCRHCNCLGGRAHRRYGTLHHDWRVGAGHELLPQIYRSPCKRLSDGNWANLDGPEIRPEARLCLGRAVCPQRVRHPPAEHCNRVCGRWLDVCAGGVYHPSCRQHHLRHIHSRQ